MPPSRKAFTLIELLIVIAIIAVLAVVVVLVLNPAELLKQARDANRLSDLSTLNNALNLYSTDQSQTQSFSLGNASSVYVSLPDTSPTCADLGLPALPSGYTYHCASSSISRNTDSTGWIPVDLQNMSAGSPLGSLPVDPTNQSSSGLYYMYSTDGTKFQIITALPESTKQKTALDHNPIITGYPGVMAQGSSLSVSPLYNPTGLVGWWPMDEGSGSTTQDMSGNGNTGIWNGSATNGSYYTSGKVGSWAGSFNGSNNFVNAGVSPATSLTGGFTISAWVFPAAPPWGNTTGAILCKNGVGGIGLQFPNYSYGVGNTAITLMGAGSFSNVVTGYILPSAAWSYLTTVGTFGGNAAIYMNGVSVATGTIGIPNYGTQILDLGGCNVHGYALTGSLDDVRIYDRALSTAEIQALYNAEK